MNAANNYHIAHHIVVETVFSTTLLNIRNQPLHWSTMKSPGSTINMTNDITRYKFSLECQSTLKHFHWVQDCHGMAKGPLAKCTEPGTTCLFQTANGWWWKCEALLTNYIKRMSRHHKNFKGEQSAHMTPASFCLINWFISSLWDCLLQKKQRRGQGEFQAYLSILFLFSILTKLPGTWRSGTKRQVWWPVKWKVCT